MSMSELSFELKRDESSGKSRPRRDRVFVWSGNVGGLGLVELVVPALELVPVTQRGLSLGAMATGESIPMSSYTGLPYDRRPRLARGKLNVAGRDAAFSRNAWRTSRQGRALRIWAVGREYTYLEDRNKRHHVLERNGTTVMTTRSSWRDPKSVSGKARGEFDSVDISLAVLFEGIYTRNLSLRGALVSAPGRMMDRFGSLS